MWIYENKYQTVVVKYWYTVYDADPTLLQHNYFVNWFAVKFVFPSQQQCPAAEWGYRPAR